MLYIRIGVRKYYEILRPADMADMENVEETMGIKEVKAVATESGRAATTGDGW